MQNGYEFTNTGPVVRPDYDHERLLGMAGEPGPTGMRALEVEIPEGETAWNPGSTKHVIHGPCRMRFEFHPSGVRAEVRDA